MNNRHLELVRHQRSIEATPQRVQRKQAAAEEPITARIRRRQEEAAELQHAEEENSPAGHAEPGHEPPMTFQERIELERRRKLDGEGHSPG